MDSPWFRSYEPGVPPAIAYPELTLHELLAQSAERYPHNTAMLFLGTRLSYNELKGSVETFSAALAALGVQEGDRVAVHLPNCPQMATCFYGGLKAGAVMVPCNPLYTERELEFQLKDSGSETLVTMARFYPMARRIKDRIGIRNLIVTGIKEHFPPFLRLLYTIFKERKEGERVHLEEEDHWLGSLMAKHRGAPPPEVNTRCEDVACLLYTGGTTGTPKGAVLSHRNLAANAAQTRSWLTDFEDGKEIIMSVLPFFHSYGMTTCMNLAVTTGSALVLVPRFDLKMILRSINRYRPTIFPGVPTMYVAINNAPDVSRYDLKSIKACISGAAPLPVEVQAQFERLTGGRLVEGYGLSEASPVTHCNPVYGHRKVGCIGIPFPDTQAKVVDLETGEDLTAGATGELAVKGPQVMREYWQRPEETQMAIKDGWLFTGDIASMDEDGFFKIVDRKKDMIIAGGFNVYPREIEEVLYGHPKVKEAVAAGVPDSYKGESIKAYVVLKEGQAATVEEMLEYCRENLAKFKVPKSLEFRDALPKTMVGKVLRRVLVEEEGKRLRGA
ncbi:MAG: long-chain fatty acid--CoA ligase [Bacillota bacterium]